MHTPLLPHERKCQVFYEELRHLFQQIWAPSLGQVVTAALKIGNSILLVHLGKDALNANAPINTILSLSLTANSALQTLNVNIQREITRGQDASAQQPLRQQRIW